MGALERVKALLAEAPGLERASRLRPSYLPVPGAFAGLLPGLRPGSVTGVTGTGATSLALALIAPASADAWTAIVGLPAVNLVAACELGVVIDRVVVVPEARSDVVAAVVDAFDVVLARPLADMRKVAPRVRERDAVLVCVGRTNDADLRLDVTAARWHGLDGGHGHLRARRLTVTAAGRGSSARPKAADLWLPNDEGGVSAAGDVVAFRRTG
jgi:hypothetical protein